METSKNQWLVEYEYFDNKKNKNLCSNISLWSEEEPWGTFIIKAVERKWKSTGYRNGDVNSLNIVACQRIN